MLDRRPAPVEVHDCELCRALLAVGESIAMTEAAERAAAEQRRASIRIVTKEPDA